VAKDTIRDFSATASANTDIQSVNVDENCAASGINNAIRELMADLKDVSAGTVALETPVADSFSTDTISEKTSATGVTIDGVLLKDGAIGSIASAVAAHLTSINGGQIGGSRNLITNGNFATAQRSTSETGVGGSSGYFTCDRWRIDTGNTAGRVTMSQASITDLAGFATALKLDVTTADTSIASGEVFRVGQRIEGQNLQQLAKGTASAKSLTLSFYVKGNAAATYVAQIKDVDNTRVNTQNFSVTTSWTRVELTYAADTTGTLDNNNANSLEVMFWLHAGSDFTSGTFASNTWASETNANNYAGSNTSIFDSTNRELFITGVQLEIGEVATPFEHESFAETLQKCQRYFYRVGGEIDGLGNYTGGIASGVMYGPTTATIMRPNPVTMRDGPDVTFDDAVANYTVMTSRTTNAVTAVGVNSSTVSTVRINVTCGATSNDGDGALLRSSRAQSTVSVDAEL